MAVKSESDFPWNPGFLPGVEVGVAFEGDFNSGSDLFHLDLCVILLQSIWLLYMQFILQLKLFVHDCAPFINLKFLLSMQSLCDTLSPRVGVWFWAQSQSQSPGFLGPEPELESGILNSLTLDSESESHKKQGLRIPGFKCYGNVS